MLSELRLKNFKSVAKLQTIPLRPITLVYGQNSSGKSSLIQSLLLMKQSLDPGYNRTGRLVFRGDQVDLGSFKSCIHRHSQKRELIIGLTIDDSTNRFPGLKTSVDMHFQSTDNRSTGNGLETQLAKVKYKIPHLSDVQTNGSKDKSCIFTLKKDEKKRKLVWSIGSGPTSDGGLLEDSYFLDGPASVRNYAKYLLSSEEEIKRRNAKQLLDGHRVLSPHRLEEEEEEALTIEDAISAVAMVFFSRLGLLPTIVEHISEKSAYRYVAQRFSEFRNEAVNAPTKATRILERAFANLSYLGPLRSPPQRHYVIGDIPGNSVGKMGELMPNFIFRTEGIDSEISSWFKRFGIPYTIKTEQIGSDITGQLISLNLTDTRTNTVVGPSDVGFGIGQLLPILVEGTVFASKTICVEQPEIHLHPKLQAHLADFFIATSVERATNSNSPSPNQWLIETHSEALILRLQKRIREGKISPKHVSVLYVSSPGESGARVEELKLDEMGDFIDEWPEGFFEESFNEIFGDDF
jgi:predicted ATPase